MHAFCPILAHMSLHDQAAVITAVGLRQSGSDSRHAGRRCPGEGLCFAMCRTTSERLHSPDNRRGKDLVQHQHRCCQMVCICQCCPTQLTANAIGGDKGSWVACYSWCHPAGCLACEMLLYSVSAWHVHNLPACCRGRMHFACSCQRIPCRPCLLIWSS